MTIKLITLLCFQHWRTELICIEIRGIYPRLTTQPFEVSTVTVVLWEVFSYNPISENTSGHFVYPSPVNTNLVKYSVYQTARHSFNTSILILLQNGIRCLSSLLLTPATLSLLHSTYISSSLFSNIALYFLLCRTTVP